MNNMNNVSRIKKYPVVVLLIAALFLEIGVVSKQTKTSFAKTTCKIDFTLIEGETKCFKSPENAIDSVKSNKSGVVAVDEETEISSGSRYVYSYKLIAKKPGKAVITIKQKNKSTAKLTVKVIKRNGVDVSVDNIIESSYCDPQSGNKAYTVIYKITNKEKVFLDTFWFSVNSFDADDPTEKRPVNNLPPGSSAYESLWLILDHMPTKEEVKPLEGYQYERECYRICKNVSAKLKGKITGNECSVKNNSKYRVILDFNILFTGNREYGGYGPNESSSGTYSFQTVDSSHNQTMGGEVAPKETYYLALNSLRGSWGAETSEILSIRGAYLVKNSFASLYTGGFCDRANCGSLEYPLPDVISY